MQNHDDGGGGRGGGMRRFGDLLPTDDQGRRIIGDPGVGCRHCHTVLRSYNEESPNVVVFRPGVECCVAAVLDRITGINEAIQTYRYQVDIEGVPVASVEGKTVAALDERKRLRKRLRELERKK